MKRRIKNILLCLVMILSLTMTVLTVVHAAGGAANAPSGFPAGDSSDGAMTPPDGTPPSDGEIIGEITVDGAEDEGADAGSTTPPALPGNTDGRPGGTENGNRPDGMGAPDGNTPPDRGGQNVSAGSLTGHLLFAALWIFLFAFSAAWAVFSRMNAVSPFPKKAKVSPTEAA